MNFVSYDFDCRFVYNTDREYVFFAVVDKRYYQCITWRHGVYTKVEGRENLSRVENKVKVLKICLEVRTPLQKKQCY